MLTEGIKYDTKKEQWHLLPLEVLRDVVHVLMCGARKYEPDNWKLVKPKERYYDACIRHLSAWQDGERIDFETGKNHLAHAICCLIFLLWHDKQENNLG